MLRFSGWAWGMLATRRDIERYCFYQHCVWKTRVLSSPFTRPILLRSLAPHNHTISSFTFRSGLKSIFALYINLIICLVDSAISVHLQFKWYLVYFFIFILFCHHDLWRLIWVLHCLTRSESGTLGIKGWASSRENLSSGFATRVDSSRSVQPQKLGRALKF